MIGFMEGNDKRFVIPVYQRKYDWKYDNCRQLYNDLKRIVLDKRDSHFFGSIVSAVVPNGSKIEYHIIDGQQRLTTISLLMLAIRNLIITGKIKSSVAELDKQIEQRFLIAQWVDKNDNIKLRPVKSDREALKKLFGPEADFDNSSNLTINYQFFCDALLKEDVPVADLYEAIGKLEIISITLDYGDNAQLIFESLNSTGLALTEGDKIRNYILMGLPAQSQSEYYDTYWVKIEKCTSNDVSGFIRDYLSVKQLVTPTMTEVYRSFKNYVELASLPTDGLLADILCYARLYEKMLTCKSGLKEQQLDDCLYRFKRLEIVVTRPFFMEVLRLNQVGKLTDDDVLKVFLITENYLFRRNICEVPTNALNKIFLTLNKEILRYDNTADNYVAKFTYALLAKKESGRFPDDDEFRAALSAKQIYQMRGKYKAYLFERFENYGTVETKDVYTHLDNRDYSIEHIMPQHLTPAWTEALGANATEIHNAWLHRLANLTLTAYNPDLSNSTFAEKRNAPKGGYKSSGLRMNQNISYKSSWGEPELEERNTEMLKQALNIWEYPKTDFTPSEEEFDSCTLDDEDYDLTGRDLAKYSYLATEQPVTSWADMFEHIVKFLHQKDKSVLTALAYSSKKGTDSDICVSNDETSLRSPLKIDENIYIEKNTSTSRKITILRKLFASYGAYPMDLVFYLKDSEAKLTSAKRYDVRKRYWEYALPIIQSRNIRWGVFSGCNPNTSNTESGFFGISGFSINCIANFDNARIESYFGSSDTSTNKSAFDALFRHKDEIEAALGVALEWDRADTNKASLICYETQNIGLSKESDWQRMAQFHADWSSKICDVVLPYLFDSESLRLARLAGIFREWALERTDIKLDIIKSNRTYTRFTTDKMSCILPNTPGSLGGWNTDNRYFYEIINRNGKNAYIQLAISAKNITEELL